MRRGSGSKYHLDSEWLREQYIEKGLSTIAIAKLVGCDNKTVWAQLRRHGIPTRPVGLKATHCRRAGHLLDPDRKWGRCPECHAEDERRRYHAGRKR
jgi:uncharacterized paraquat-inducible protein A